MTLLFLENNELDLKFIKRIKVKLNRNQQKSKYEKIDKEGDSGASFQGRHAKGIKRHDELNNIIKESRLLRSSIELKMN